LVVAPLLVPAAQPRWASPTGSAASSPSVSAMAVVRRIIDMDRSPVGYGRARRGPSLASDTARRRFLSPGHGSLIAAGMLKHWGDMTAADFAALDEQSVAILP